MCLELRKKITVFSLIVFLIGSCTGTPEESVSEHAETIVTSVEITTDQSDEEQGTTTPSGTMELVENEIVMAPVEVVIDGPSEELSEELGITSEEFVELSQTAIAPILDQAEAAGYWGSTREQCDFMTPWGIADIGNTYLARELNISEEALKDAQDAAASNLIENAVADNSITRQQADIIRDSYLLDDYMNSEMILAEALGVSTEELNAARLTDKTLTDLIADLGLEEETVYLSVKERFDDATTRAIDEGLITSHRAEFYQKLPLCGFDTRPGEIANAPTCRGNTVDFSVCEPSDPPWIPMEIHEFGPKAFTVVADSDSDDSTSNEIPIHPDPGSTGGYGSVVVTDTLSIASDCIGKPNLRVTVIDGRGNVYIFYEGTQVWPRPFLDINRPINSGWTVYYCGFFTDLSVGKRIEEGDEIITSESAEEEISTVEPVIEFEVETNVNIEEQMD